MTPCNMNHQSSLGASMTRGSERNSARYFLNAAGVGASGVPRLVTRTPVVAGVSCLTSGLLLNETIFYLLLVRNTT